MADCQHEATSGRPIYAEEDTNQTQMTGSVHTCLNEECGMEREYDAQSRVVKDWSKP